MSTRMCCLRPGLCSCWTALKTLITAYRNDVCGCSKTLVYQCMQQHAPPLMVFCNSLAELAQPHVSDVTVTIEQFVKDAEACTR